MSAVMKRIYKLQNMKINIMMDTIQALIDLLVTYLDELPKDLVEQAEIVSTKFINSYDRIDEVRQKNINNFYNKLRNSYEGLYNMEVEDGKENKEEN